MKGLQGVVDVMLPLCMSTSRVRVPGVEFQLLCFPFSFLLHALHRAKYDVSGALVLIISKGHPDWILGSWPNSGFFRHLRVESLYEKYLSVSLCNFQLNDSQFIKYLKIRNVSRSKTSIGSKIECLRTMWEEPFIGLYFTPPFFTSSTFPKMRAIQPSLLDQHSPIHPPSHVPIVLLRYRPWIMNLT